MVFLYADSILEHVPILAAGALVGSRACLASWWAPHALVVRYISAIAAVTLRCCCF